MEFAICAPLVILLALACADFGRISHHAEVVANAARAGAERGAMQNFAESTVEDWKDRVRSAVIAEMANVTGFDEGELLCQIDATRDSENLWRVSVTVEYPFETIVDWRAIPSETLLHERIEFRQFR